MTDNRIEKIRAEIERLQQKVINGATSGQYSSETIREKNQLLVSLISFIDSMQEEPKFKTGDRIKPIDSCLGSPRTIVDVCDSWYVTDQSTLDFEFEDNWELVEEPVSEDLEKELDTWRHNHFHGGRDKEADGEYLERSSQLDIAKHFFELGLRAQKGE